MPAGRPPGHGPDVTNVTNEENFRYDINDKRVLQNNIVIAL